MARDLTFEEKRKTSLKADQLLEAYEIGVARDTGNPYNDLTGIGKGKKLEPGTPPPKELQLPLFDTRPYTKSMMITPNSIMIPFSVKDDTPYSVPGGGSDGPRPTPEEAEDLLERGWSNQMQINPQIAELMLPGERGSTPGGLGNMNKDSLERWIKENNITGPAADKIRRKHKGLQGGINLPLASIPESYERENVGGNLRDLMLPLLIKNYGKDSSGEYQDPDKLLQYMKQLG